jgi:hypothetical protein
MTGELFESLSLKSPSFYILERKDRERREREEKKGGKKEIKESAACPPYRFDPARMVWLVDFLALPFPHSI